MGGPGLSRCISYKVVIFQPAMLVYQRVLANLGIIQKVFDFFFGTMRREIFNEGIFCRLLRGKTPNSKKKMEISKICGFSLMDFPQVKSDEQHFDLMWWWFLKWNVPEFAAAKQIVFTLKKGWYCLWKKSGEPPFGCNWCRISSINSMKGDELMAPQKNSHLKIGMNLR